MQRASGGELAPIHGSGPQLPAPKQKTPAPASATKSPSQPQKPTPKPEDSLKPDVSKSPEQKKPSAQMKQPTIPGSTPTKSKPFTSESQPTEPIPKSGQAKPKLVEEKLQKQSSIQKSASDIVFRPSTSDTKQISPGPKTTLTEQKVMHSQKSETAKLSQDSRPVVEKAVPPDTRTSPHVSQHKTDPKSASQSESRVDAKVQKQLESMEVKQDPKKVQPQTSPKPDAKQALKGQAIAAPKVTQAQPQALIPPAQKTPEQSRRFSLNVGGVTDAPKPQPTTPQETVTGKLFGFGASIFSQASNLISSGGQSGAQTPGPLSASPSKQPASPAQPPPSKKDLSTAQPLPKMTPMKKEGKTPGSEKLDPGKGGTSAKIVESEKKLLHAKDTKLPAVETKQSAGPPATEQSLLPASACPLCKTDLNFGSQDPPNYNTCTECKKVVCNLCGFNPTPHITEVITFFSCS